MFLKEGICIYIFSEAYIHFYCPFYPDPGSGRHRPNWLLYNMCQETILVQQKFKVEQVYTHSVAASQKATF